MNCQYIAGEPTDNDLCKCGKLRQDRSAYCEEHHAICYRTTDLAQPAIKPVKPPARNKKRMFQEYEIVEIRKLCAEGTFQAAVAKKYGVHRETISKIVRRKTWSHVKCQ